MGYAVIIFVVLLTASVVIATAVMYGVAKDSQTAPLKARNNYADIKTGQAQTGLTIVNTCLSGSGPYVVPSNSAKDVAYILSLTVRNTGSIVLNPNYSTIFYNKSLVPFNVTTNATSSIPFGKVWSPLINSTILVPNIFIYSSSYPLRLMMAVDNGITAIAPTAPTNFSGIIIQSNTSYSFSWTPSNDNTGIAYYILYAIPNQPPGTCDQNNVPTGLMGITIIPGNVTSNNYPFTCGGTCKSESFMITAVNNIGNMGIPSVAINCNPPNSNGNCNSYI